MKISLIFQLYTELTLFNVLSPHRMYAEYLCIYACFYRFISLLLYTLYNQVLKLKS